LLLHGTLLHGASQFDQPIGQRALAVINVAMMQKLRM